MEQHVSWNAVPDFVFGLMAEYKDKCFLSIECSSWACSHILHLGTSAIDFRRNSVQVQTAWLVPAISLLKNIQKSYFCAPVVSQSRRIIKKKKSFTHGKLWFELCYKFMYYCLKWSLPYFRNLRARVGHKFIQDRTESKVYFSSFTPH